MKVIKIDLLGWFVVAHGDYMMLFGSTPT